MSNHEQDPDLQGDQEAIEKHEAEPDWSGECSSCGASPTHPLTGMCGPCSFGEAETVGGNW